MGLKHPVQYSEKLMPQLAVREKKKWREEEGERERGVGWGGGDRASTLGENHPDSRKKNNEV